MGLGLNVTEAIQQLKMCNKKVAKDVLKVVVSARNSGENNFGMRRERMLVGMCEGTSPCLLLKIRADEAWSGKGQHRRRVMYHSKGRYGKVYSQRTHINVVLRHVPFVVGTGLHPGAHALMLDMFRRASIA